MAQKNRKPIITIKLNDAELSFYTTEAYDVFTELSKAWAKNTDYPKPYIYYKAKVGVGKTTIPKTLKRTTKTL